MGSLTIAVAVVTRGRPETVEHLIEHLAHQTRAPDLIILSAQSPDDLGNITIGRQIFGSPGSSVQRNRALRAAKGRADVIVFFDDDFVPVPEALASIEALFLSRESLVGATGHVIADGIGRTPISNQGALDLIARRPRTKPAEKAVIGLYGCNMAIRMSAADGVEFDEALPFYGWQEDLDFGSRLRSRGDVIRTPVFGGVHRGVRTARMAQRGFGYAQVANPVYLMADASSPRWYLTRLMVRNIAANILGTLKTMIGLENPWTDRKGRLAGNCLALADLLQGRLSPARAAAL